MEVNQKFNRKLKNAMGDTALSILLENQLITEEDLRDLGLNIGYMFTTEENELEALFAVFCGKGTFYFAIQHNQIMLVNLDQDRFEQTVEDMKQYHPCISDNEIPETALQKNRRENNNRFIRDKGIAVSETLPCLYQDDEVSLKDTTELVQRAIACLLTVQIACDIAQGDYEESVKFFRPMYEQLKVADCLNGKEKRILDGSYSTQDAIDMDWAYEAYWALCWCLGLVDDIRDAGQLCDCEKAVSFIMNIHSQEELMAQCTCKTKEEILDMLDLYYRYQWAVNDNKVNPSSSIGTLNPSIVIERRRALEWVISTETDWYNIDLDA